MYFYLFIYYIAYLCFNKTKNNNYELKGSFLNADPIITSLLESKDDQQLNIFKENIKIS